ncbi:GNAT family protein [Yeosuana sp. MJ-SS3]|uniref:GNAT family protein n=1 Tax=Gilvirhabdus luticola TaxID=3079858 RepID=A0ABU3UA08_9FLAO|nr:GNAT family protein [Yeosuana sp. MJ-SS3]MDU8887187.1 GNAT family protein [Yeosuana sp. MJ-SS3]
MNKDFDHFSIVDLDFQKAELFFQLIDNNKHRLEDYFAGILSKNKSLADTKKFFQKTEQRINDKTYFPYIILNKEKDKYIGLIDIKNIDWRVPKAEIGYFIDSEYQGKRIISKALGFVVNYIVEKHHFKKLLCRANGENVGSIQVALKNGFELEGTIRNDYVTTKGRVVDLNYYGRIF